MDIDGYRSDGDDDGDDDDDDDDDWWLDTSCDFSDKNRTLTS